MAGHAKNLCKLENWIVKRANKIEIGEYEKDKLPLRCATLQFHGPYYSYDEVEAFFAHIGEYVSEKQKKKIQLMDKEVSEGGKGFIILKNVTAGMNFAQMRDLKLGKYTTDAGDQERRGVTGFSKYIKISRHWLMDKQSQSRKRGFRDEDQWKATWRDDNLVKLNEMLSNANRDALMNISDDLQALLTWLDKTNVVYVGMSVLVVVAENEGKAVPIDFEHPINRSEQSFYRHKKGIIEGVRNLQKLVIKGLSRNKNNDPKVNIVYNSNIP